MQPSKFTTEWSQESIMFLDTTIIRNGNRWVTDLQIKPTDTHQYLHHRSCQALRLQRICSKFTDYEHHVEELKGYLVKRGYDRELIQQQIDKATNTKGEELLISRLKKASQVTPLVVTYHPDLPYLHAHSP